MVLERFVSTFRLALKSLGAHKLRSTLTVLGVVFGVGSVIVMLAVGEGARFDAVEKIKELGATNIILRSVRPTEVAGESDSGAVRYGLTAADLDRIASTIPSVVWAMPIREHRQELRYQDRKTDVRVVGVTSLYHEVSGLALREGRFINELDGERFAAVAVLAAGTADALFPFEDPLGRSVRVGEDRYYRVVGVTEARGPSTAIGSVPTQDYSRDIYIPFATDRAGFGEVVALHRGTGQSEMLSISQITVAVDDTRHVKNTADVIQGVLRQYHKQDDTAITVPLDLLEKVEQTQRIFNLVLGSIASISLVVGGIGIMNIMLATVTERTREIGIRRALGAKRRDIAWQFLCETVTLSGTGGLLGLAAGLVLTWLLTWMFGMSTLVRLWSPLLALTISIGVGVVFGAYPAHRASFMDPVEALRHE